MNTCKARLDRNVAGLRIGRYCSKCALDGISTWSRTARNTLNATRNSRFRSHSGSKGSPLVRPVDPGPEP